MSTWSRGSPISSLSVVASLSLSDILSPIFWARQGQKLAPCFPFCSKMPASLHCEKGKYKKINTDNKNNVKAKFLKHLLQLPRLPVQWGLLIFCPWRGGLAHIPGAFPAILFSCCLPSFILLKWPCCTGPRRSSTATSISGTENILHLSLGVAHEVVLHPDLLSGGSLRSPASGIGHGWSTWWSFSGKAHSLGEHIAQGHGPCLGQSVSKECWLFSEWGHKVQALCLSRGNLSSRESNLGPNCRAVQLLPLPCPAPLIPL